MQPILKIDLTNQNIGRVEISKEWDQDYLGGASLAAHHKHLSFS
jgi:aldehyde:ferredoxin oxidoreductase